MWCELVLQYQKTMKRHSISVGDDEKSELFYNQAISRKLSSEGIKAVLDELCAQGYAQWSDESKTVCVTSGKKFGEWGTIIHSWAVETGASKSICTVYELQQGDATTDQAFHGQPLEVLLSALKTLQSDGKCNLYPGDDISETGVKFC